MIKLLGKKEKGNVFLFGLSEGNLNRLEFNQEPIFFDFGYAKAPHLYGLIIHNKEYQTPKDIGKDPSFLIESVQRYYDKSKGVTPDTLHIFPIVKIVLEKLRSTPFWAEQANCPILTPFDSQMFFSGRTEEEIKEYFLEHKLINNSTKIHEDK